MDTKFERDGKYPRQEFTEDPPICTTPPHPKINVKRSQEDAQRNYDQKRLALK
jgi:hypothetical protein